MTNKCPCCDKYEKTRGALYLAFACELCGALYETVRSFQPGGETDYRRRVRVATGRELSAEECAAYRLTGACLNTEG